MYCNNCGVELGAEGRFCGECGTAVKILTPTPDRPALSWPALLAAAIAGGAVTLLTGTVFLAGQRGPLRLPNPRGTLRPEEVPIQGEAEAKLAPFEVGMPRADATTTPRADVGVLARRSHADLLAEVKNAKVRVDFGAPEHKWVQLRNGSYRGAEEAIQLQEQFVAYGDLNGDGLDDVAAVLREFPAGGNAAFDTLCLLTSERSSLRSFGAIALDPAGREGLAIESLRIEDGMIVLHGLVRDHDDPRCCPTQKTERRYGIIDDGTVAKVTHWLDLTPPGPTARPQGRAALDAENARPPPAPLATGERGRATRPRDDRAAAKDRARYEPELSTALSEAEQSIRLAPTFWMPLKALNSLAKVLSGQESDAETFWAIMRALNALMMLERDVGVIERAASYAEWIGDLGDATIAVGTPEQIRLLEESVAEDPRDPQRATWLRQARRNAARRHEYVACLEGHADALREAGAHERWGKVTFIAMGLKGRLKGEEWERSPWGQFGTRPYEGR